MCFGTALPTRYDASMPMSSAAAIEWYSWGLSAEGTEACGKELGRRTSALSEEACGLESTSGPCDLGAEGMEACGLWGRRASGRQTSGLCGEWLQVKQESSRLTVLEHLTAENRELREMSRAASMRAIELETENRHLHNKIENMKRALDDTLAKPSSCAPATRSDPLAGPIPDAAATTVFPRRKPGHTKREPCSAAAPVAVSLEVLESLAHYSLPLAASKLGISATAMKKACRKLGISRWPYLPARTGRTLVAQVGVVARAPAEQQHVEQQGAEDVKVPGLPPMLGMSSSMPFSSWESSTSFQSLPVRPHFPRHRLGSRFGSSDFVQSANNFRYSMPPSPLSDIGGGE